MKKDMQKKSQELEKEFANILQKNEFHLFDKKKQMQVERNSRI